MNKTTLWKNMLSLVVKVVNHDQNVIKGFKKKKKKLV